MRMRYLAAGLLIFAAVSANAESRLQTGTVARNPITIESQIREVTLDGDNVVLHLERQPYTFIAVKWLRVRTTDGRQLYARDLQSRDNIHLEGDLDHNTVDVYRITLQRRDQHLGGD